MSDSSETFWSTTCAGCGRKVMIENSNITSSNREEINRFLYDKGWILEAGRGWYCCYCRKAIEDSIKCEDEGVLERRIVELTEINSNLKKEVTILSNRNLMYVEELSNVRKVNDLLAESLEKMAGSREEWEKKALLFKKERDLLKKKQKLKILKMRRKYGFAWKKFTVSLRQWKEV